jgi:hypothetical protein
MTTAAGRRSGEVLSLRPSIRAVGRRYSAPTSRVALLLLLLVLAPQVASGQAVFALVALGVACLLIAVGLASWFVVGRVWLDENAVHRRTFLGTRTVERNRIATVLLLPRFRAPWSPPVPRMVLLDQGRRPLLRVAGWTWDPERIRSFAEAVGAPVTVIDDEIRPMDLPWRRLYEMPWRERHPVLAQLASLAAALLGVALIVWVAMAALG